MADRTSSSSHSHARYVPDAAPSSLTAALRRQSHAPPPPSSSTLRPADDASWLSTKSAARFLNYLPQDEAVAAGRGVEAGGLDALESQRVVDHLNRELSRLLKLDFLDFWDEVVGDASLQEFLNSYLQFRSR